MFKRVERLKVVQSLLTCNLQLSNLQPATFQPATPINLQPLNLHPFNSSVEWLSIRAGLPSFVIALNASK
jgi:hypothetical protein